tara:strand:- start:16919 stop:17467 length:549 start_codon:yes stop_codon:yes gene_type:complete
MHRHKVLVLNKDYTPISIFPLHVISAQRAIVRVFNGTCNVVTEYDDYIPTKYHNIKFPAVIVRDEYLKRERLANLNSTSLWYRDMGKCAYCKEKISKEKMTIDHVLPRSKGGQHRWDNVVTSCGPCNYAKGDSLNWTPIFKPYKPTYGRLIKHRKKFPITIYHESWLDFIGEWNAPVSVKTL